MARMSIDDSALRDPRVLRLAKRRGWSRRETIGALLDIWAIAYDRASDVLPQEDIDIAAGDDNFACDMVVVGLAEQVDGGVRIRGATERIEYLIDQHEKRVRAGIKGGIRSGEARRKSKNEAPLNGAEAVAKHANHDSAAAPSNQPLTGKHESKQCLNEPEARRSSPVPDPVSASAPVSASSPDPVPPPVPDQRSVSPMARQEYQPAVEAFDQYFRKANGDTRPLWNGGRIKSVQTLVKSLGLEEVLRRIRILDTAPPSFPPQPWDLPTFVKNIDRCAQPTRKPLTPLELQLERIKQLEDEERSERATP